MFRAPEGDERRVILHAAHVLHNHYGLGAELIDYSAVFVNQFGSNECKLAEKVCEGVSKSSLTARGPSDNNEQPAQIVSELTPHLQARKISRSAQDRDYRLTFSVNIARRFRQRHHRPFWT